MLIYRDEMRELMKQLIIQAGNFNLDNDNFYETVVHENINEEFHWLFYATNPPCFSPKRELSIFFLLKTGRV